MRRLQRIGLFSCALLLLVQAPAWALRVTELEVRSALGEPLDARIMLRDWEGLSLADIHVTLATETEYATAGLPWLPVLAEVRVRVVKTATRTLAVVLTSQRFIHEPVLPVLLYLEWPDGRLQQAYSLLFDPPVPAQLSGADVAREDEPQRYRVVDGDSLSKLAARWAPAYRLSPNQLMVNLWQLNPAAFEGSNSNNLRLGAELILPNPEDLVPVAAAAADAWAAEQQRLREKPAQEPVALPVTSALPPVSLEADQREIARLKLDLEDAASALQGREQELQAAQQQLAVYRQQLAELRAENARLQADIDLSAVAAVPVLVAANDIAEPLTLTPVRHAESSTGYLVVSLVLVLMISGGLMAWLLWRQGSWRRVLPAADQSAALAAETDVTRPMQAADSVSVLVDEQGEAKTAAEILKESEVFLQYGFHQRGRELLEEALRHEPNHLDYQLQLLRILHGAGDAEAYLQIALVVREQLPVNDSRWSAVCQRGRELCPDATEFVETRRYDTEAMLLDLDAADDELEAELVTQSRHSLAEDSEEDAADPVVTSPEIAALDAELGQLTQPRRILAADAGDTEQQAHTWALDELDQFDRMLIEADDHEEQVVMTGEWNAELLNQLAEESADESGSETEELPQLDTQEHPAVDAADDLLDSEADDFDISAVAGEEDGRPQEVSKKQAGRT